MLRALCVVLSLLVRSTVALEVLLADGNPHSDGAGTTASCCPAQALPPQRMLGAEAALLSLQYDTFVRRRSRSHLGHPVEVFTFKQPARLSHLELGFDLALVDEMDPVGILEIAAQPAEAADSWFPDYAWSHYVICAASPNVPRHLGWRFTRKPLATGAGPDTFVALIVRTEDSVAEPALAALRAEPLAVSEAIPKPTDGADEHVVHEASLKAATLLVGVDAPAWMVTMFAAITARSSAQRSP